jgi:hypothetical protein
MGIQVGKPSTLDHRLDDGNGGEGGSFTRHLLQPPSSLAGLSPGVLLAITLVLSALLVGLVTVAIAR